MPDKKPSHPRIDKAAFLSLFYENAADGIMLLDAGGVVQFANPAAQALFSALDDPLIGYRFDIPAIREKGVIELPDGEGQRIIEMKVQEVTWQDQRATLVLMGDITSQVNMEENLRLRERLLIETGRMAKVGGWQINLGDGTVWWSEVTRDIHEVDEQFKPGLEEALSFFPGDAGGMLKDAIDCLREEGIPYDMELPFVTAKGRERYVRTLGQAEFKNGNCVRVWGTFQDISEQRATKIELQKSEEKYRNLFKNTINGFVLAQVVVDADGEPVDFIFLEVNDAFEELLSLDREQVIHKSAFEVLPELQGTNLLEIFIEVAKTGTARRYQIHHQALDKYFQITAYLPTRGQIAIIFNDFTDQVKANQALQESENIFRTLFETMAQGVLYQNADGKITDANPAAQRILGLSLAQMQGKTSMDPEWEAINMKGEPVPGEKHPAMVALRTGKTVENFILGVYHPHRKEHVWTNISAVPQFRDGESEPYQVVTTFLDITDTVRIQKVLEERLKELRCLTTINTILYESPSLAEIARVAADALAAAMQFPKLAVVVIEIGDQQFGHEVPPERLDEGMQVPLQIGNEQFGLVTVAYTTHQPAFLPEERQLLQVVADQFGLWYGRQRNRTQLEESETRFRTAIIDAPYPSMIHAEDGQVITVNRAWSQTSGYSPDELQTVSDWIQKAQPSQAEQVAALIRNDFEPKESLKETQNPITTKSGETRLWTFSSKPLGRLPDGRKIAITMARDVTEREHNIARFNALREIDQVLGSTLDLDEVLARVTSEMGKILQYDSMSVMLVQGEILKIIAVQGFDNPDVVVGLEFPSHPDFPNYEVIEDARAVTFDNISKAYPKFTQPLVKEIALKIKAWLGVPLVSQDGVIGMFSIDRTTEDRFTDEDIDIAMQFANRAAIAIRNAELFEQTRQQVKQLEILTKIDEVILNSLDLSSSILTILSLVKEGLGVDAASIIRYDNDQQVLWGEIGVGFQIDPVPGSTIALGQGMAGSIALQREPVFVEEIEHDDEHHIYPFDLAQEGVRSYFGFPLIAKGKLEGVLQLFHRSKFEPDADWVAFAETLAQQTAVAINDISLFNDLITANKDLINAYDATIKGWARALEMRDKETGGHSQRVVELSVQLAERLGFDEEALTHFRRGVYLHDIGKMGISDEILQKPGPLSDEEWVIMHQHPDFAYEMLKDVDYLQRALNVPHYHQERWDGSGYPEGLSGEDIPLDARIFAVVDVWDALTSDRYYRKAWSRKKTITYLEDNAGVLFDAKVVAAFLDIIRDV